ncbi:PRMT5-domain-containing protein [Sparassis latifolia]|uniref:Protein arginine N-methyltransferase n=1 Tax=Sparassis crispa TaxID=139825 RepID=A0A401H0T4_9APHY|nr:Protein arginine N-methyltransferase skb1 [Sparassis crispa]GBE88024.1 Protein arginine N-methyltransferase skb1 [Sparassis crispa]
MNEPRRMFTFTSHLSHSDISQVSLRTDPATETPILHATAEARAKGYDAVCFPLTNDIWKMRWRDLCLLPPGDIQDKEALERRAETWRSKPAFMRDEVTITRIDEAEGVVVMMSDWLELDAPDDWVRHDSEIALQQELAYASYLNVHTAILPPPRHRAHLASYARTVNTCINAIPYIQLSIRIPIYNPMELQFQSTTTDLSTADTSSSLLSSTEPSTATWEMWDTIRSVCGYNPRLTLTLDMTPPMPSVLTVLGQWSAEPVRHIFLPASTFIANAKGYPVLPKGAQSFIRDILKLQPNVILSGTSTGRHERGGEAAYSQYVRHLEKTSPLVQAAQTSGTVENFAQGYQDYLQAPLQPLMDNLQSVTYNTFEQDPVKYKQYEQAIFSALSDWRSREKIVICVAGAGRGPLVARCVAALKRARRDAYIYAIEKNPNAYVTLQERRQREWGDKVQLVFGDMRSVEVPPVDILVSELLGSFGDNELSPECLDGAMRFLKADGISIPASYTAHIAPLSSSKLFHETRVGHEEKATETPYVVMFQAINILSGNGGGISGKCGPQVQECWEFEHPRRDVVLDERGLPFTNSHNIRSAQLTFHIPHAGVLHGLAGYFEAILYRNIGLSIHPDRMHHVSKDMLSWFPIFFPFKEPLYLPTNSELHVSIWRLTNERQVWYEWYAEAFLPMPGTSSAPRYSPMSDRLDSESTPILSPSPLVDAVDIPVIVEEADEVKSTAGATGGSGSSVDLIKIGQTSLHNPRGRSSWIGL